MCNSSEASRSGGKVQLLETSAAACQPRVSRVLATFAGMQASPVKVVNGRAAFLMVWVFPCGLPFAEPVGPRRTSRIALLQRIAILNPPQWQRRRGGDRDPGPVATHFCGNQLAPESHGRPPTSGHCTTARGKGRAVRGRRSMQPSLPPSARTPFPHPSMLNSSTR